MNSRFSTIFNEDESKKQKNMATKTISLSFAFSEGANGLKALKINV